MKTDSIIDATQIDDSYIDVTDKKSKIKKDDIKSDIYIEIDKPINIVSNKLGTKNPYVEYDKVEELKDEYDDAVEELKDKYDDAVEELKDEYEDSPKSYKSEYTTNATSVIFDDDPNGLISVSIGGIGIVIVGLVGWTIYNTVNEVLLQTNTSNSSTINELGQSVPNFGIMMLLIIFIFILLKSMMGIFKDV